MSDYFDLIERRESCRSFAKDRPVEREKLQTCVEAARLAPSACNNQPWKYLVVTDAELVKKLRPCVKMRGMNAFVDDCPVFAVVMQRGKPRTDTGAYASGAKRQDYRPIDIGLSVSQFCYAATEQGLSTCILGWLDESRIKKLLGIQETCEIRLVLAVGYAADDTLRKKDRKPLSEIATFY